MELNKIYNEDCLIGLRNRIEDNSIDLTLTSPPYDNMRDYNGIAKQWSFDKFKSIADELYRVTKDGGVVVWVVNDGVEDGSESGTSFRQALYFKEIGFRLHDTMIYQKANYIPLTHRRYEQSFEYMFVFSKGRPKTFNPIKIPCKGAGRVESNGESRRGTLDGKQAMRGNGKAVLITKDEKIHPNIFCYTVGGERSGHPAAFPNKLAEDHIKSWSNEGDLILDPFMGSATTAIMSYRNGRNFIGFELDEKYYNIAKERIDEVMLSNQLF